MMSPFKHPIKRLAALILKDELIAMYAEIGGLQQVCHRQQNQINAAAQLLINEPTDADNARLKRQKATEKAQKEVDTKNASDRSH